MYIITALETYFLKFTHFPYLTISISKIKVFKNKSVELL